VCSSIPDSEYVSNCIMKGFSHISGGSAWNQISKYQREQAEGEDDAMSGLITPRHFTILPILQAVQAFYSLLFHSPSFISPHLLLSWASKIQQMNRTKARFLRKMNSNTSNNSKRNYSPDWISQQIISSPPLLTLTRSQLEMTSKGLGW
jgi:hypothetical protein